MKHCRASVWLLLAVAGLLVAQGVALIAPTLPAFAQRQCVMIAIGSLLLAGFACVDYRAWRRFAVPALIGSFVLLVLVFMPGIGLWLNGAQRWVVLGGLAFQPAELAKAALVLFLAAWLATDSHRGWVRWAVPLYAIVSMAGLIVIQPNRTATFIVGAVGFRLLAQGGVPWRVMAPLYALPALGMAWLVQARLPRFDLVERLRLVMPRSITGRGFCRPYPNEMIERTGWTGCGLGDGWLRTVPSGESFNSYFAALVAEEFGWLGLGATIAVFILLLVAATRIARAAPDRFGRLLALGIVALIEWQLLLHLLSNLHLLPLHTSLPFVSYGGSNLCLMLASIGVLVSIARASAARPPQPQR